MNTNSMRDLLGPAFLGADSAASIFGCPFGPNELRYSSYYPFEETVVREYRNQLLLVAVMPTSIDKIAERYATHFDESLQDFQQRSLIGNMHVGYFRSVWWHLISRKSLHFEEACKTIGRAHLHLRCIESAAVMVYAAVLYKELNGTYPFEENVVYGCSDCYEDAKVRVGVSFNGKIHFSPIEGNRHPVAFCVTE